MTSTHEFARQGYMVSGNDRRATEEAQTEIQRRIGRNGYLHEFTPTREKYVRYCETLVRNKSKPNAEAMLEAAKWRLKRTVDSIDENLEAVKELERCIALLSSAFQPNSDEYRNEYRNISDDDWRRHFLIREKIKEYTGKNSVNKKSHIKYRYNL